MRWAITYVIPASALSTASTSAAEHLNRDLGEGGRCVVDDETVGVTLWLDESSSIGEAAARAHRRLIYGLTTAGETAERARALANSATVRCHRAEHAEASAA